MVRCRGPAMNISKKIIAETLLAQLKLVLLNLNKECETIPAVRMASKIHPHQYASMGKSPGARRLFVFMSVPKIIRKA